MLNDIDKKMAAKVLRLAADQFSNHGCNDLHVPNTPENYEFMRRMYKDNGQEDECPPYMPQADYIYLYDWWVMRFLADVIEES